MLSGDRVPDPSAFFGHPDPSTAPREQAELAAWLGELGLTPRGAILDVGGGPGFAATALASRPGVERVVLLEYSPTATAYARARGVEAYAFDFDGASLAVVVRGRFDVLMVRYSLAWCADLPRLAGQLREVAAPAAALVISWVLPTRGACLGSGHESSAPRVLWSEAQVDRIFATAGWAVERTFVPSPPLQAVRGPWLRTLALPFALAPGPLPKDPLQRHAGRLFRLA